MEHRDVLATAHRYATRFLDGLDERFVGPCPPPEDLIAALGGPLGEGGTDPGEVVRALGELAEPGLVASAGGRYFGFVIGGSHAAGLGADWLTSAWDQNAGFYVLSPAAAAIEEVVAGWLLELLDLPREAGVGFVTGCQMANFMGLAAARQAVYAKVGWDAAVDGLQGAPRIRILAGDEAHGTIDRALSMLGLGSGRIERVPSDEQGRMQAAPLRAALEAEQVPTIVCAQAGNVNTGAFDPLDEIGAACRQHGAWLHVDGAFGLWARCSPGLRELARGAELADSWATDAHKWLNVPYDAGVVIVRDSSSMLASTAYPGAYLVRSSQRSDRFAYTPESSRRARAIPIYATLRELGRTGVAALVERSCRLARRASEQLQAAGCVTLHDVVLNQVMFRHTPEVNEATDAEVDAWITRIQQDGTCWLGGTHWQGQRAVRMSVCNWQTSEEDIDASVAAILRCRGRD